MRNSNTSKIELEARLTPSVPEADVVRFEFHKHKIQSLHARANGPIPVSNPKMISRLEKIRSRNKKK